MSTLWRSSLIENLRQRRVIIVIGAGVSRRSNSSVAPPKNPPLWEEFLQNAVEQYDIKDRYIRKAIKEGDYLHACEWIKTKIDEDWIPFLRKEFVDPGYKPSSVHDKIFRLDQRVTFSLNFDSIYETHVVKQTSGRTLVKQYHEEDVYKFLRDKEDYIIKMHGSVDSPDFLIFSEEDYAKARVKYTFFYEVLGASILSHTFMFIGCGLKDPNITFLLENHNFKFPQEQPHYMVIGSKNSKGNDALEYSLRRNRNLKCIRYDPANNHAELDNLLDDLLNKI